MISKSVALPPTITGSEPSSGPDSSSTNDTALASLPPLELPQIKPGLLPTVKALPFKQSPKNVTIVTEDVKPKPSPAPTPAPKPAPVPEAPPKEINADWLLEKTALSLGEKRGGSYEAVFNTDLGSKGSIRWGLSDAVIGGIKSVPQFAVSFSCDPQPELPLSDESDPTPFFKVATAYGCDISLTPSIGNDKRPRSKQFSFKTNPGSLSVRPSSVMDSLLKNDANHGGFVFANKDNQAVSVRGITFNASYTGLNIEDNPLLVRFIDSHTEHTLGEYHLEGFDKDPSYTQNYTRSKAGIQLPFVFDLEPVSEKLLKVQLVGVRKFGISGIDPTVKLSIIGIALDRSDVKTVTDLAEIKWSCIVATTQYDANATSGPFATGQACKD